MPHHLPKLASLSKKVHTTDPRGGLRLRTGVRAGPMSFSRPSVSDDRNNGNRLFDSQNQHYVSEGESFDV